MAIVFTIFVGVVVGLIDALPMFLKKMNRANCWSAFLQYVVVTFVVFNTTLPQIGVTHWLVGPIVAVLMALPMVVMIAREEKKAVPFVLVNAVVLGFIISAIKHFTASFFA
ncbi:hypothetical protein [uncultured Rikenella sp.]|uniref:hypothetical protein n=2 Tax=uncultured Rikenella sp. TaxID=368003 RepID=UPI00260D5B6F|nr:hypothetical protein [uncultured Rikenella sp.]